MMKSTLSKTIIIMGPTASGKSDLAIVLAKKYDGEIISADSRQVYRGMDIGTGKVVRDLSCKIQDTSEKTKVKERKFYSEGIRHHLIDVASPRRNYNVTHFIRDAKKALVDIRKRGKTPIICGGTGFWIQSLLDGNSFPAVKPNPKLRTELSTLSTEALFTQLTVQDPVRAKTIDPKNKIRLIRALEIIESLGKVPAIKGSGTFFPKEKKMYLTPYKIIVLNPPKEILHTRIEKRLKERLEKGMIEEVKHLHEEGVSWKRLERFGLEYTYIALLLQKKITLDKMKERLNFEIRHYAKRQITWLRRFEKQGATIHWITNLKEITTILEEKL